MKHIESHIHTHIGSVLDGYIDIKEYTQYAKNNDIDTLFISDHGSQSGCFSFYKECKKNNIFPIFGVEFYKTEKDFKDKEKDNRHLILYAKNEIGYKNLLKLVTESNVNGFYYKPRINNELIEKYKCGLIASSACIGSDVNVAIIEGDLEKAENLILYYKKIFNSDFYLELQLHDGNDVIINDKEKHLELVNLENKCNNFLIKMSKKHNIKLIVANDSHYIYRSDFKIHDILLCKNTNSKLSDENRFRFPSDQFYIKNTEEILDSFKKHNYDLDIIKQAILNKYEIIDKCKENPVEIKTGEYYMPKFEYPENFKSEHDYLKYLIKINIKNKYKVVNKEILDRINHELKIIKDMGFSGYMLIVYDYINWARNNDIPVGPGRGSIGGSIIAYILDITKLCPLKYDLLFSRFLDESRKDSICDVDTDFCEKNRERVIDYFREKYGFENTGYIYTSNTLKIKGAIKVVMKAYGVDFSLSNNICKKISDDEKDLSDLLSKNKYIKKIYEEDEMMKGIFDNANKLVGVTQATGCHASGVLCSSVPIYEISPIIKVGDKFASGNYMKEVDELGLVKMDFLGLRNLTVIKECLERLKNKNIFIDLDNISLEDKNTYDMLCLGKTAAIFQFEGHMAIKLMKEIKPRTLDELAAITSINRPGPLSVNAHVDYLKYKNNPELINYIHPNMKPILSRTYSNMLFQEQIMKISIDVAGFSPSESNKLRVSIGKKQMDKLLELKEKFINGCVGNGLMINEATKLFNDIEGFGAYCFNASHAYLYSLLSYQTAYLKCNYSTEYMCSYLNSVINNQEKLSRYIGECFKMGIKILSPDINISTNKFEIDKNNNIRFGLTSLKGIGEAVINPLIEERNKNGEFKNIWDLLERVPKLDKTSMECLLRVGALNSIIEDNNSKYYFNLIPYIIDAKKSKEYINGESNLESQTKVIICKTQHKNHPEYKILSEQKKLIKSNNKQAKIEKENINIKIQELYEEIYTNLQESLNCEDFSKEELVQFEEEYMGYSISYHPLILFSKYDKYFDYVNISDLLDVETNSEYLETDDEGQLQQFKTIGIIESIKEITTKNGKQMGFLNIEYLGSKISFSIPPWSWESLDLLNNYKKNDLALIVGTMEENSNKSFSDYRFNLKNICKLSFINIDDNYITIDISNKDKEQQSKILKVVKDLSRGNISGNKEIKYIVKIKNNDIIKVLKSEYWISDKKQLMSVLYQNNLI